MRKAKTREDRIGRVRKSKSHAARREISEHAAAPYTGKSGNGISLLPGYFCRYCVLH
jgi:hypothetical protein